MFYFKFSCCVFFFLLEYFNATVNFLTVIRNVFLYFKTFPLCLSTVGIPRYQSHSSVCDRKDFVLNFNGISSFHPSAGGSYYHHHHHHHPQSVCQDIKPCVMWALLSLRTSKQERHHSHIWTNTQIFFFFGLFVFFVIFEGFVLAWMVESALTCLPPMQPNIFIIVNSAGLELCIEENMNEETPEAFRSTTSPIWTLTSFLLQEKFQKHDFRCVCSCNTCKPIILHVTVSYYTHNALGFHELQRILHLLYNPFTVFSFCFVL